MWVEDPRFTESIDRARAGLAAYQSAAAVSWAAERGGDSEPEHERQGGIEVVRLARAEAAG